MATELLSVDDAVNIIRRDYFDNVQRVADDLRSRMESDEITTRDDLYEALTESIDSHQRVIYTFQAKLGMLVTDNAEAMEDETGETGTIEQQMFFAMQADVRAQLERDGFDLNEPFTCAECKKTFDERDIARACCG
jgi:serine/threonine protein kinase HipA of HipAB toxin-antitoxin module